MQLDIQGDRLTALPTIRQYIERRVLFELGKFGNLVERVRIRLREEASESGIRILCGTAVNLVPDGNLSPSCMVSRVRIDGTDVCQAIDEAVQRVAGAVGGELARWDAIREARALLSASAGARGPEST